MPEDKFHERPCRHCGVQLIDVREACTGATYPVEAMARLVEGYVLLPAPDPRMNPFAIRAEVRYPHLPRCQGTPVKNWTIQDQEESDLKGPFGEEVDLDENPMQEESGEPVGVGSDPIVDNPPELPIGDEDPRKGPH